MRAREELPPVKEWAAGAPASKAVLLVHGTLDQCASFRRAARYLPDRRVAGYDRRGWAESRHLGGPGTGFRDHVADLAAVLAGAGMSRPTVVGHSYGALIALAAAASEPDLVGAVVAFEPPVRWLPWWPVEAPWEALVREAAASGPAAAAAALLGALAGGSPRLSRTEQARTKLAADGAALVREMTDPELDLPCFDPLTLPVPVVTAAGGDTLPHHHEVSRRLAELVPNGRFVEIPAAGHPAHVTHPQQFAALVGHAEDLAAQLPGRAEVRSAAGRGRTPVAAVRPDRPTRPAPVPGRI